LTPEVIEPLRQQAYRAVAGTVSRPAESDAMATHAFHKTWLRLAAVLIACFAPLLFLSTIPGLAGPARLVLDVLAWPVDGFPSYEAADIRFLSALTGGFLLGWGVLVWNLASRVYDLAPEAVRRSHVTGVCAWFLLDSAGSITSGNWPNALWNVLVLLALVGPLWVPARA
jgi:hypothetical protein